MYEVVTELPKRRWSWNVGMTLREEKFVVLFVPKVEVGDELDEKVASKGFYLVVFTKQRISS